MRINNENRVNLNKAILSSDEHQYENMLSTLTENIQKFETAGKKLVMTGPSQGPPPPWGANPGRAGPNFWFWKWC